MPIERANVIDVISFDEKSGCLALVMTERRAWDGSDARLFELQEKINAYLSFALDGEMTGAYPQFLGKALSLRLECAAPPDARTLHFLGHVRQQIGFQGIGFEVRVTSSPNDPGDSTDQRACGSGCGCR
jgi:hypothetical protein